MIKFISILLILFFQFITIIGVGLDFSYDAIPIQEVKSYLMNCYFKVILFNTLNFVIIAFILFKNINGNFFEKECVKYRFKFIITLLLFLIQVMVFIETVLDIFHITLLNYNSIPIFIDKLYYIFYVNILNSMIIIYLLLKKMKASSGF